MKYLFILLLISISSQAIAQDPEPELFQTWYLYDVLDGDDESYEVYLIDPPVTPYMTISEDLNFIGEGACNSFSGVFSLPFQGQLIPNNFINTTDDCGISVHIGFEDAYFGFMGREMGYSYNIVPDGAGLRLGLSEPFDGYAIFKNYPLSSSDFDMNEVKIYPNPSDSEILIRSRFYPITKIELYNLLGEYMRIPIESMESVNVSNLASGIYVLRIFTEEGVAIKKILKI